MYHMRLTFVTICLISWNISNAFALELDYSSFTNKPQIDKSTEVNKQEVANNQTEEKQVNSNQKYHKIIIYREHNCAKCDEIQKELDYNKIEHQEIDLQWNRKQKLILSRKTHKTEDSYIFIDNKYIGNHDELSSLMKNGRLFRAIQNAQ